MSPSDERGSTIHRTCQKPRLCRGFSFVAWVEASQKLPWCVVSCNAEFQRNLVNSSAALESLRFLVAGMPLAVEVGLTAVQTDA
jgi:hypothetical protein